MAGPDATSERESWSRRGLSILRRVLDLFPLTLLGILVGSGAGAALRWVAYPELDLVWLVVGYAALGLVALAVIVVVTGAIRVKVATRVRPHAEVERHRLETGRFLPTGFEAPALLWLPLAQVDWTWERPDGAEVAIESARGSRMREKVAFRRRGHVRGVRRRIVIQDAFGLARVAVRQNDPVELTVLPHAGKLRETPMLVSLAGGDERPHPMGIEDGDRVELRRYVPGDSARLIHWKVFGRTRQLMVRMPERALSPARRTVAYQVAGPGDEASAAAARVAVESGVFGAEWSFCADGSAGDTQRIDEAVEMIVRSAGAAAQGGRGLEAFLRRAERAGPASAVIFVPPQPGSWLEPVVAAVRARAPRTRLVVATDGVDRARQPSLWRRLLTFSEPGEGTPANQLDEVLKALAATRAEVVVLDRQTGRRLGKSHVTRWKTAGGTTKAPATERAA